MRAYIKQFDSLYGCFKAEFQMSLQQAKKLKKPFLILFFIYLLGISAILRANFNYIDDMGRAFQGYKGWTNFSRHLSQLLSGFLHADNYLTDISPLPQIVAILLLAAAGVAVLYVITGSANFSMWGIVAAVPLGLSPYFLECISYKYDSPYMALSILGGIAPLLLRRKRPLFYIAASALGMLVVCTTYQAATGIFPMFVALLCFFRWNRGEPLAKIASFLLDSVIGYVVGLLLFQVFLRNPYSGYVDMELPPLNQLFSVVLQNYRKYFGLIRSDLKTGWLALILLLCLAFLYVCVRGSQRNRLAALVLSAVTLAAMLLFCFGVYPAFQSPLFDPRAMYGFGVFVTLIAVTVTAVGRIPVIQASRIISLVLSWCFFVFAFTYGNALYVQKTYTDFRIQMVIDDLKTLDIAEGNRTAQIVGSIGRSPVLRNMPQNYQILNRLVPVTFQEGWDWGVYGIAHYYDLDCLDWNLYHSDAWPTYDLPVLTDTIYHTIYGDQTHIKIVLK